MLTNPPLSSLGDHYLADYRLTTLSNGGGSRSHAVAVSHDSGTVRRARNVVSAAFGPWCTWQRQESSCHVWRNGFDKAAAADETPGKDHGAALAAETSNDAGADIHCYLSTTTAVQFDNGVATGESISAQISRRTAEQRKPRNAQAAWERAAFALALGGRTRPLCRRRSWHAQGARVHFQYVLA